MKFKDKQAILDWEAYRDNIIKSTPVPKESKEVKKKRIDFLLNDFEAFCKFYFPDYCTSDFAPFHKRLIKAVLKPGKKTIVRKWARAHAKSVMADLFIPLYRKFRKDSKVTLLVSWSHDNATELLTPLRLQLEYNQRIINDFGLQRGRKWEADSFVTKDNSWYVAVGLGESPRGKRNEQYRPTDIIVDDADNDEVCRNPKRLNNAWEWLMGALYPTFDIKGDNLFLVVNNQIAEDCIVERAYKIADNKETINILDAEGNPSWKERFTLAECLYMIDKIGYRMAQREYFNKPSKRGTVFRPEWIKYDKIPALKSFNTIIAYIDPAYKSKTSNCYKAVKVWGKIGIKYYHIKAFMKQCSITTLVKTLYDYHQSLPPGTPIQYYMEQVFLQDMFFDDFIKEGRERGWMLPIKGDTRKKPEKFQRIEASAFMWERDLIRYNEAEKNDPEMIIGIEQTLAFEKGYTGFIDGPDADEGALSLLNNKSVELKDFSFYNNRNKPNKYRF